MNDELYFIRVKDIPLTTTVGEIATNISKAYKIMTAIHEGRNADAFNLANEILNSNDEIIEREISKETLSQLMRNSQKKDLN
jgi:hypothetical protein